MDSLYETLKRYSASSAYPFHMPGHKRNKELIEDIYGNAFGDPFAVDITEIDGFDDLHHAEGILKAAMMRMADAVGAKESFFVVNGSSAGLLAAIYAACPVNGAIAVARDCHRSVAHAIQIRRLKPYYIYPQLDCGLGISMGITCGKMDDILEKHVDISAVLLTSPTYEGVVSNIREIAKVVHKHGAILIVDEAHGAHLPFAKDNLLPESAITQGADLVIQSLHKTLPALTQSAALHICSDRVNTDKVKQGLRIFETSSPSYVMMACMDACISYMKQNGMKRLTWLQTEISQLYETSKKWKRLRLLQPDDVKRQKGYAFDWTKLVLYTESMNQGGLLHEWLSKEYQLQPEMSVTGYVILMTTVGDTKEGFNRLCRALQEIDVRLLMLEKQKRQQEGMLKQNQEDIVSMITEADIKMLPGDAVEKPSKEVFREDAVGRISAEMAYLYPPGIPFLMPGEEITEKHIKLLKSYESYGREIHGMEDETGKRIRVIRKEEEV